MRFSLAGFESHDGGRRPPSGNANNRSNNENRQGGRNANNYNQQRQSEQVQDGYVEDGRLF